MVLVFHQLQLDPELQLVQTVRVVLEVLAIQEDLVNLELPMSLDFQPDQVLPEVLVLQVGLADHQVQPLQLLLGDQELPAVRPALVVLWALQLR